MTDVLVTGGTGYIGRHLVPALASRDHRVRMLVRQSSSTRDGARRLGLVTLAQMIRALVWAVEHPPASGAPVLDVSAIRQKG
jgi:nucleoside-diphosphate-sugar epimerase